MNWKNFFINGISVFLGLIFFTSGMAKVYFEHKFPGIIGPVWLEDQLAKYELGLYARFIAYSQITIGFTLLTLRYRTLGALMLLPMVLNIMLVTISLNWQGTPYVLAFFLVLNLILVAADAKKLLHLLGVPPFQQDTVVYQSSPILSGLIWLAGYILALSSVSVSFQELTISYIICALGIAISLFPYFREGTAGSISISKRKSIKEKITT